MNNQHIIRRTQVQTIANTVADLWLQFYTGEPSQVSDDHIAVISAVEHQLIIAIRNFSGLVVEPSQINNEFLKLVIGLSSDYMPDLNAD